MLPTATRALGEMTATAWLGSDWTTAHLEAVQQLVAIGVLFFDSNLLVRQVFRIDQQPELSTGNLQPQVQDVGCGCG